MMMDNSKQLSLKELKRLNKLTNKVYEDCGEWPKLDDELEPLLQRLSDIADEITFITYNKIQSLKTNEYDHKSNGQILPDHLRSE